MNPKFFGTCCIALLGLFIAGCTDVPLSFSTKVLDDRIFGYWQAPDSAVFQIIRNSDGSATLIPYQKDQDTKDYKPDADPAPMYFTNISVNSETVQFFSIESKDDKIKYYTSSKYYFSPAGDLITENIDQDFLEKSHKKNEDGLVTFGTPENYRAFVKSHLKDPEMFEEATYAKRLEGLPKN